MIHELTGLKLKTPRKCGSCRALQIWNHGKCEFGFKTKPIRRYIIDIEYKPLEPCLKAVTCRDHAETVIAINEAKQSKV